MIHQRQPLSSPVPPNGTPFVNPVAAVYVPPRQYPEEPPPAYDSDAAVTDTHGVATDMKSAAGASSKGKDGYGSMNPPAKAGPQTQTMDDDNNSRTSNNSCNCNCSGAGCYYCYCPTANVGHHGGGNHPGCLASCCQGCGTCISSTCKCLGAGCHSCCKGICACLPHLGHCCAAVCHGLCHVLAALK